MAAVITAHLYLFLQKEGPTLEDPSLGNTPRSPSLELGAGLIGKPCQLQIHSLSQVDRATAPESKQGKPLVVLSLSPAVLRPTPL